MSNQGVYLDVTDNLKKAGIASLGLGCVGALLAIGECTLKPYNATIIGAVLKMPAFKDFFPVMAIVGVSTGFLLSSVLANSAAKKSGEKNTNAECFKKSNRIKIGTSAFVATTSLIVAVSSLFVDNPSSVQLLQSVFKNYPIKTFFSGATISTVGIGLGIGLRSAHTHLRQLFGNQTKALESIKHEVQNTTQPAFTITID